MFRRSFQIMPTQNKPFRSTASMHNPTIKERTIESTDISRQRSTSNVQQFNRSRESQVPRKHNDLRELLSNKHHVQSEIKSNEPPPDSRYSFLSDPWRESENKFEQKFQYSSARFSNKNNNATAENRNYNEWGRTSERGRGGFRKNQRSRSLDRSNEYWNDKQQPNSETKKTWNNINFNKNKFNPQQTFNQPYKNYNDEQVKKFESGPRYCNQQKKPGPFKTHENYENNIGFQPRQYNHEKPDHNQHSYSRRGHMPSRPNCIPLHPVNIKVECNIQTGERVCTVENVPYKKKFNKQTKKLPKKGPNANKHVLTEANSKEEIVAHAKGEENRENSGNDKRYVGIGLNFTSEEVWSD